MEKTDDDDVDLESGSLISDDASMSVFTADLRNEQDERKRAAKIVPYLARRNYHIPGNNWFQDWFQYCYANNHPIFGFFCHYKHHPVSKCTRVLVLFGTLSASLAIVNLFYLYFLNKDGEILKSELINAPNITIIEGNELLTFSNAMTTDYQIALWTLGSAIHTMYDISVWHFAACSTCAPGGYLEKHQGKRWLGTALVFVVVFLTAATSIFLVVIRGAVDNNENLEVQNVTNIGSLYSSQIYNATTFRPGGFVYLRAWIIEFVIALFVYDTIFSTILFTGVLGCGGEIPVLGGRPYELNQIQNKKERRRKKKEERKSLVRSSVASRRASRASVHDIEEATRASAGRSVKSSKTTKSRESTRGSVASVKSSSRDSVKSTSKESVKSSAKASVKSSSKESVRSSRRNSARRDSVTSSKKTSVKSSTRDPAKASMRVRESSRPSSPMRSSTRSSKSASMRESSRSPTRNSSSPRRSSKRASVSATDEAEYKRKKEKKKKKKKKKEKKEKSSASRKKADHQQSLDDITEEF